MLVPFAILVLGKTSFVMEPVILELQIRDEMFSVLEPLGFPVGLMRADRVLFLAECAGLVHFKTAYEELMAFGQTPRS